MVKPTNHLRMLEFMKDIVVWTAVYFIASIALVVAVAYVAASATARAVQPNFR
jgi:hypothetical protein